MATTATTKTRPSEDCEDGIDNDCDDVVDADDADCGATGDTESPCGDDTGTPAADDTGDGPEVEEDEGCGGCASGGGLGAFWLLALPALLHRRRKGYSSGGAAVSSLSRRFMGTTMSNCS